MLGRNTCQCLAAILFIVSACPADVFAAAGESISITVSRGAGAEDCPDATALAVSVNRRFRAPRVNAAATAPSNGYAIEITHTDRGYRAVLRGGGNSGGEREVTDPSLTCGAMADALAVTLAILVQAAAPPQTTVRSHSAARVASDAMAAPFDEVLRVGGGFTVGLPVGVSPALFGELALSWSRWSVGAGGLWVPARDVHYGPGQVSISYKLGYLRGCYALIAWRTVRAEACLWPMVGGVSGQGEGFLVNRNPQRLWAGLGAGPVIGGRLFWRLGWELRAVAIGAIRQQRFTLDGAGAAYESGPVSLFTAASVSGSIW